MSLEDNVDGSDLHVLRLIRDLDNATHMVAQYHVRPHQRASRLAPNPFGVLKSGTGAQNSAGIF